MDDWMTLCPIHSSIALHNATDFSILSNVFDIDSSVLTLTPDAQYVQGESNSFMTELVPWEFVLRYTEDFSVLDSTGNPPSSAGVIDEPVELHII